MKHINYACETASDLSSPADIADAIGPDATGGARFDGDHTWHGSDAWNVIDLPSGADCGSLGWLMHNVLELLGIGGSEARFVYACHADWSHLWDDEPAQNEPHPTLPGEYLGMWFGGADSWNNYEGCCHYDGKWWRGGYGDTRNSAENVLHSVCDPNIDGVANPHQAWTFAPSVHVDYP
jgi:hypothetical protein